MTISDVTEAKGLMDLFDLPDTSRIENLRRRVREAMKKEPVVWECPKHIGDSYMSESVPVRKARAIALKLSHMPTDLWAGQLFAGSMTLEHPRLHCEKGFPDYLTENEWADAKAKGLGIGCFGHIVPDYPKLLRMGLDGIKSEAQTERRNACNSEEIACLDSVVVALDGVMSFASRLADRCEADAAESRDSDRADELRQMADNLRMVPAGPAETFWQALQSVWLLHMIFHSTMNGNALGRLDQYVWPYLKADFDCGSLDEAKAAELVDCFCLKFNERAQTTGRQRSESRNSGDNLLMRRTRHRVGSEQPRYRQHEGPQ